MNSNMPPFPFQNGFNYTNMNFNQDIRNLENRVYNLEKEVNRLTNKIEKIENSNSSSSDNYTGGYKINSYNMM